MTESTYSAFRLPVYGLTVIFTAWFCLGMLWYVPNNGGSGLSLPLNALCWITIAVSLIWLVLTLPREHLLSRKKKRVPSALWLLPLGGVLWSLPLVWAPSVTARLESVPHVVALWGFLCLLWWLRRLPRQTTLSSWLTVLWMAALLQGLFAFLQIAVLSHTGDSLMKRPMGIFQQANVLASFLSTGLACLLASEFCELKSRKSAQKLLFLRRFSLLFIPFMLVLIQSRVGWLGAILAGTIISVIHFRQNTVRLTIMWLLMLAGILLALAWQHGIITSLLGVTKLNTELLQLPKPFSIVDKAGSNSARVFIIQQTWLMIMHHPWAGFGYGSFEGAFARQVSLLGDFTGESTLIHPHNEILYAWAEGGLLAVFGLLMMAAGVLVMLWRRNGLGWTGAALLLPIALHMNVEYPLYQSVPHGLVLVILLSLALPGPEITTSSPQGARCSISCITVPLKVFTICVCMVTLFYMVGCLQTQNVLTRVEQQGMYPLALNESQIVEQFWNPQSQQTRLDYDLHIAKLIRYNFTHNTRLLEQYERWASVFQLRHKDPNVMASRITIAHAIAPEKFPELCAYAHRQWPRDIRFNCPATAGK